MGATDIDFRLLRQGSVHVLRRWTLALVAAAEWHAGRPRGAEAP